MLAQRVVTRLPTTIRQGSQLQRRFIHPSRSQLQAPRPNTWLARLRFRPDGKPRSKLIAFGFGSLILCNCLTLLVHRHYIKEFEATQKTQRKMIYIQRLDTTYDPIDFSDRTSAILYFKNLCLFISRGSEEEVDLVINNLMMQIFEKGTNKDGSINFLGVKALDIMRSTAEKIHGVFRELDWDKDQSTADTANFLLLAVGDGLDSLLDLASSPKYAFQKDNEVPASG